MGLGHGESVSGSASAKTNTSVNTSAESHSRVLQGDSLKGFSKLTREQRLAKLLEVGALTADEVHYLKEGGLKDIGLAENFIENVIGFFQMPLGVATGFRIDGEDYVIPMAVEETSIVAAASKTAAWIRNSGEIITEMLGKLIIGQIQIARVKNFAHLARVLEENKAQLIEQANAEAAQGLVIRGGGVRDIELRRVPRGDGGDMAVLHVLADPVDAMGANTINQVCEFLRGPIEALSGEQITMCILSNLVDRKLTKASVVIRGIDPEVGLRIQEGSLFAEQDPYRAATNNKGVLNGIDPILLATGNDWRAVEAGVHAYAAHTGQYRSITKWRMQGANLVGELIAPIIVGTVGGVTRLHPTAQMCLGMMRIKGAEQLSRIIAAVGLVQNLGALRALTGEGISAGHMRLHIKNLVLAAGAREDEMPVVQKQLEAILRETKRISLNDAVDALAQLRKNKSHGA